MKNDNPTPKNHVLTQFGHENAWMWAKNDQKTTFWHSLDMKMHECGLKMNKKSCFDPFLTQKNMFGTQKWTKILKKTEFDMKKHEN